MDHFLDNRQDARASEYHFKNVKILKDEHRSLNSLVNRQKKTFDKTATDKIKANLF